MAEPTSPEETAREAAVAAQARPRAPRVRTETMRAPRAELSARVAPRDVAPLRETSGDGTSVAVVLCVSGLLVGLLVGFLAGYGSRRPAPPVRCVSTLSMRSGDGVWTMECGR